MSEKLISQLIKNSIKNYLQAIFFVDLKLFTNRLKLSTRYLFFFSKLLKTPFFLFFLSNFYKFLIQNNLFNFIHEPFKIVHEPFKIVHEPFKIVHEPFLFIIKLRSYVFRKLLKLLKLFKTRILAFGCLF